MNVYDFDNTIYKGESTLDFFFFCQKRHFSVIKYILPVIKTLILYKACKITTDELYLLCEKYMKDFLTHIKNPKKYVKEFWDKNECKIKSFYLKQQKEDDVIISASCSILLEEICARLKIKHLICTTVDLENNKIINMCHGENKVNLFKKNFPNTEIDCFYTDSLNDLPMIKFSKKAYIVKGNKISEFVK